MNELTIEYFALLREQRGQATERLRTAAATPAALYAELQARHGFTLPGDRVRAAIKVAAGVETRNAGLDIVHVVRRSA